MTRQRLQLVILALTVVVLAPGCSVYRFGKLSTLIEPHVYHQDRDRRASLAVYRSLADEALATLGTGCPDGLNPGDFRWGFREGFAQFVYAGGDGTPPAVPPRVYWQVDNRTPAGAAAVESWFEGYRVGARVAREGGYRKTATIAVSASVRDCTACGCPGGSCQGECAGGACSETGGSFLNGLGIEHSAPEQLLLPTPSGPTVIEQPADLTEELPPLPQAEPVLLPPRQTRLKTRPLRKAPRQRVERNDGREASEVLPAEFNLALQAEQAAQTEQLPRLRPAAATQARPIQRRGSAVVAAARGSNGGSSRSQTGEWRPRRPHAAVRAYTPAR